MARIGWIVIVVAGGAALTGLLASLGVGQNVSGAFASRSAPTTQASNKPPELRTGETERDWVYRPGAIRIRLAPSADIASVVRKHGLASASALFTSPYSAGALAAGFDRAYRITVPVGEEKQVVKRLAPLVDEFDFVGLDYIDDVKQQ